MSTDTIRWAIMGTGYIANRFAQGMTQVKDATLCAVVSRDEARGRAFAGKYGGGAVYTDLNLMLLEESPDVLYIGTPNDCHYAAIVQALNAGVNVLSEKPMVDNRRQWDEVTSLAKEKDLFLMEGMWTRCFPAVCRARQWIAEGRIGKQRVKRVIALHAVFGDKLIQTRLERIKRGDELGALDLTDGNSVEPGDRAAADQAKTYFLVHNSSLHLVMTWV